MAQKGGYGSTGRYGAVGIQGTSVQVNVVGCRHLTDKEWFTRQDPYVVIEYSSNRFRTRTDTDEIKIIASKQPAQNGGKNPSFNEKFTIPLIDGLRELTVQVWNSNTMALDDFIGSTRVSLEKVLSTGYDDTAWTLKSKHGKNAGEVNLILHHENSRKEDIYGAQGGYQGAYPPRDPPSGYPPSAYPPSAQGFPTGYPPAQGPPAGYSPPQGASAYPPPPRGGQAGYPPVHGASSGYSAAPAPSYPPGQPYPAGPSGQPPAPSASSYPPRQLSHGAAPYGAPGYPPHAPSGHYPAPAGYPGPPPPVYGVPPEHFGKHGSVHLGSSGHYKHGKHKKKKKAKKSWGRWRSKK